MSEPLPLSSGSHAAGNQTSQEHAAPFSGDGNAPAPAPAPASSAAASSEFQDESLSPEHTGVPLQPMQRALLNLLDVDPNPAADAAAPHTAPIAPLAGARAPDPLAGAPAHAPLAGAAHGSDDAALAAAFLEPARADQGQRWVDVNLALPEDIWSMFCNPNLNGGCVFLLELSFYCFFLNALLQVPWQKCGSLSLCPKSSFCDVIPGTGPPFTSAYVSLAVLTFESYPDFQKNRT